MSNFQDLNIKNQQVNNSLINKSERNNTISSDIPSFSQFDKSFQQATTFDSGKLIPILCQEVYPGDIYEIDIYSLIRLSAQSSTPFMNINYDINFFFVPYTQLDKEFKNLMGENPQAGFVRDNTNVPQLKFGTNGITYNENDLANYFNVPINTKFKSTNDYENSINLYPFLAYGKVWNDWYRDQNYQGSINILTFNNSDRTISSDGYHDGMSFYESIIFGKGLAPTSKLPSYFTTILPYSQKGMPININNLNNVKIKPLLVENTPARGGTGHVDHISPYRFFNSMGNVLPASHGRTLIIGNGNDNISYLDYSNQSASKYGGPLFQSLQTQETNNPFVTTSSIYTINDLRNAIVYQHLLETFALCGSRYVEQLSSIWGIEIDPKQIDRCELIGGVNETLKFSSVVQTSQTTIESQLGNIVSNLYNEVTTPKIEYASSQHGLILGVLTCRTLINNGGQGMPTMFRKKDYLDFWNPKFNGIGEQPVKNEVLYYDEGQLSLNDKSLGWNEPFIETKYNIDNANGYFSLKSNVSLFSKFLFGEKYLNTPIISDEWMRFNPNIIGNTLYNVSNSTKEFYHQFISIFTFDIKYTTKQPLFNKPSINYI